MVTATTSLLEAVEEIGPQFEEGAAERDSNDEFVASHYAALKERGLISALVPGEFGGGDASFAEVAEMLRRLGYYDGPTALALAMHQHLVAAQVFNHHKGRPAPLLAKVGGEKLVLVSTGARDWLESNGEALAAEGGFRVSARKSFASGSPVGDMVVTSAPFNDPKDGWQVLHFAVPMKSEGVSLENDWRVHGMRATGSQTVVLDSVFVPEGTIALRRPRGGFHDVFNVVIHVALPLIVSVYVGIAERAVEIATGLAKKRAGDPVVQFALGEACSAAMVAAACQRRMVEISDGLDFIPTMERSNEMLALKSHVVQQARRAVECAMEASGGAGFYRSNGLERLLRDVRAGDFHPLPARQQMLHTGRVALGLDPVTG